MRLFLIFLLIVSASCQRAHLRVRTEYVDESYLASSQIQSPNLSTPCFCGEQLVISYRGLSAPGSLSLHLRFSNHEVEVVRREVTTPCGYWVYRLVNESFRCKGPIIGYKAELFEGERCISTFAYLWAEPLFL